MIAEAKCKGHIFLRKNECHGPQKMAQLRLTFMAVTPNDVRGRRNLPVNSQASSALQQGRRKRLSGATRQSSAPTPQPRPPRRKAHLSGSAPSSFLAREHQQSSPTTFTCQFRIRASAGLVQGGSIPFRTLPPGGSVNSH